MAENRDIENYMMKESYRLNKEEREKRKNNDLQRKGIKWGIAAAISAIITAVLEILRLLKVI